MLYITENMPIIFCTVIFKMLTETVEISLIEDGHWLIFFNFILFFILFFFDYSSHPLKWEVLFSSMSVWFWVFILKQLR